MALDPASAGARYFRLPKVKPTIPVKRLSCALPWQGQDLSGLLRVARVSAEYFDVLGIGLKRGREIEERDGPKGRRIDGSTLRPCAKLIRWT